MMTEYPPQTSLPFIAPGWKYLLVGKLIESCSRIKHKMNCILSNNAVGETSCKFEHSLTGWFIKNCHSFSSRMLSLQTYRLRAVTVVNFHDYGGKTKDDLGFTKIQF